MRPNPWKKYDAGSKKCGKMRVREEKMMSFGKQVEDSNHSGADKKSSQQDVDPSNDQPKTARIRQASFSDYFLHTDKTDEDVSQRSMIKIIKQMQALEQQNKMKKLALDQASNIIKALQQQIRILEEQLHRGKQTYETIKQEYQKEIDKTYTIIKQLEQQLLNQTVVYPKNQHITPVKKTTNQSPKRSRVREQGDAWALHQIQKILMREQIERMKSEFSCIETLIQSQKIQIKEIKQQTSTTKQIFSSQFDQIIFPQNTTTPLTNSPLTIKTINQFYQQIIRNWQHYSNSLRVFLFQCIDCLKYYSTEVYSDAQKCVINLIGDQDLGIGSCFLQETLLTIVSKDIKQVVEQFYRVLLEQNKELKKIIQELIDEIRSSQR